MLVDQGHEVLAVVPFPHYRESPLTTRKAVWIATEGLELGSEGEKILRTGFIPASDSLTSRVLNQISVATTALTASLGVKSPVRLFRPDVVIGTVPALPTAVVAFFIAKALGAKLVIDLRDAWPSLLDYSNNWNESTGKQSFREKVLSKGPLQILKFTVKYSLKSVFKAADLIIVTADKLRSDLTADGVSIYKTITIRNVFPSEGQVLEHTATSSKAPVLNVLYAGTIGRAQGLENVLEAAEIAANSGVHVSLKFVGAGAARPELEKLAEESSVTTTFEPLRGADALDDLYEWADTALVHLKSWKPLESAIPSKTYELMERGIHITAVVKGETAELVSALEAGSVVPPGNPQVLAETWVELSRHREKLRITDKGARWVEAERTEKVPKHLSAIFNKLSRG